MNTNLEKIFNLEPVKAKTEPEDVETPSTMLEELTKTVADIDKINEALPQVVGLEASEQEMDELAKMATEGYQNLMELGMNVETRHAAEIFGAASNLLGHALTAKKNKIEKQLKMIELQLKKASLDLKAKDSNNDVNVIPGSATVIDRNSLIAEILKKNVNPAK
jgi:hypothetical protein